MTDEQPIKQQSVWLINESPLTLLPTVACVLGIDEAIFLQQVRWWLKTSKHKYDGRTWIYNKLPEWQEQMPFFTRRTLQRIIATLRDLGVLLITDKYNSSSLDRTSWYAIDYNTLDRIIETWVEENESASAPKWRTRKRQNGALEDAKMAHTIIRNQEITKQEITNREDSADALQRAAPAATPAPLTDPYALTEPEAETKPPPLKDHPLIVAYRSLYARNPDVATMQFIINANPPLDNWEKAIKKWKFKGYNRMNFDGMVQWALNPSLMEKDRPPGKGSMSVGQPPPITPEKQRQMDEAKAEYEKWKADGKG